MTGARSRFTLPEVQGRAAEDHMDVLRVGRAAALDVRRIKSETVTVGLLAEAVDDVGPSESGGRVPRGGARPQDGRDVCEPQEGKGISLVGRVRCMFRRAAGDMRHNSGMHWCVAAAAALLRALRRECMLRVWVEARSIEADQVESSRPATPSNQRTTEATLRTAASLIPSRRSGRSRASCGAAGRAR